MDQLIVGELLSEILVILLCGSLLTLAQVIEEQNVRFRDNVILALTTVRLSTDKIFGWQPTKASTPLEITVLAIYGWIHWLLLSVASALDRRARAPAGALGHLQSGQRGQRRQPASALHGAAQLEPVFHGLPLQHGIHDAGHDVERADRGSAAREE